MEMEIAVHVYVIHRVCMSVTACHSLPCAATCMPGAIVNLDNRSLYVYTKYTLRRTRKCHMDMQKAQNAE